MSETKQITVTDAEQELLTNVFKKIRRINRDTGFGSVHIVVARKKVVEIRVDVVDKVSIALEEEMKD